MQREKHICEYHQSVENVKPNHRIPASGCEFENDPGNISAKDQREKKKTLSDRIFHPDCFYDLGGPAGAETNHHDRFTNCTDVHKYSAFPVLVFYGLKLPRFKANIYYTIFFDFFKPCCEFLLPLPEFLPYSPPQNNAGRHGDNSV